MKKKLIALVAALIMLFQTIMPAIAIEGNSKADTKLTPSYTPSAEYQASKYYTQLCNVNLTGDQRKDLINVAYSQLGYHEGDSNADLGGGNTSGTKDYTEYGRWYGTNPGAWCAMFVSWCARQAGIEKSKLNNASYAKPDGTNGTQSGCFHIPFYNRGTYTPVPGDLIFFCWAGDNSVWSHVAIVTGVDSSKVYYIDGNGNNNVSTHSTSLSNNQIRAYGVWSETTSLNPLPGKPIIHVNPGTTIASTVIWWYACENTHHYDLRIYNEDGSLYDAYYNINDIYKRLNLPSGRYTADVVACTTSDGPYAWSERSDAFDVIDYFSGRIGQSIIYNGHTYMMLGEHAASWYEAELTCEKLGGHLATITSSGEQEAIYNMIKSSGYTSIWWWLGATDAENEGTWKWVTGEPFTYSNWAVGEPCNDPYAIDGEDYAHMYGYDGTWNDVNIIQFNPNILLELDYANDNYPGQPVYSATYNNHTYSIYSHVLLNWHDAESFCEKHGGTLATVTSQEEYNVIIDLINQAEFGFVWLGATDEKQEGKWEWVTGEPFEYTNWLQGQPDNYGNSEHYMNTYVNANENKWNDTSENSLCYFILETVNTHTVTFKDGLTGNTISTSTVEHGKDATFPAAPVHEGYTFTGWDKDGKNITADTTITAQYKQNEAPTPTPTSTPTPTPTPTAIPENAPQAVTESKTTQAGQTVTVTVNLKNNPGFMYMRAVPVYDTSVMTLTAVSNGIYPSTTVSLSNPSYIWEADQNITGDGVLLTLTFTVKDGAAEGTYTVGVSIKECYNYDEDDVTVYAANGTITVTDILYGDCNGDGVVDGKDLVRLRKYLAQYDDNTGTSPIEISAGADCNGDGKIDGKDLVRLRKYLAQYDDNTGTSPIHLGPEN